MCQSAMQQEAAGHAQASTSSIHKEEGNALYREGKFLAAAACYTKGLKVDATNEVLYSNRSAALLQINKTTKALADAEQCIQLRPDWDKGHSRKAAVLEALGRLDEALSSYQTAARLSPGNKHVADKIRSLCRLLRKSGDAQQEADGHTACGNS